MSVESARLVEGRRCAPDIGAYFSVMGSSLCSSPAFMPEIISNVLICPPAHGRDAVEKMSLVVKAYSLHILVTLCAWVSSFIFLLMCCGFYLGNDFVGLILTLLCFMWVLSFAQFPTSCCLEQHINGCILSSVMIVSTALNLSAAFNFLWWSSWRSGWLWITGILWLINTLISVCATSFTIVATQAVWPQPSGQATFAAEPPVVVVDAPAQPDISPGSI